jgi:hypothetical protein
MTVFFIPVIHDRWSNFFGNGWFFFVTHRQIRQILRFLFWSSEAVTVAVAAPVRV